MFRAFCSVPCLAVGALFLLCVFDSQAHAEQPGCSALVTRASLSSCAIEASPAVKVVSVERDIASARYRAASPWFPSNPVLGLSVATRHLESDPRVINWYASLSQEIEIGGQRSTRQATAEAEGIATSQRLVASRRAAAMAAWKAYFEVLAARDEVALARRLETLTSAVAQATQAFADRGSVAGIDADITDAAATRARQVRIAAEARFTTSKVVLASLLGEKAENLKVEGELEPLRDVIAKARAQGDTPRPELGALEWQARAFEARSSVYERQRIPNITLSGFVQNDGFNERVFGVGLAIPIPLPYPLGRTYSGEIAEAQASARYTRAEATRIRTELHRETSVALAEYEARVAERDAIAAEKLARADATLSTLAEQVKKGNIAPRDAFVAQQTLIELLQGCVGARRAVCLASVELARAAGLPLEEGEP